MTERILTDVPCAECGYNLRTLPITGACSECGHAVRATLEVCGPHADHTALEPLRVAAGVIFWTPPVLCGFAVLLTLIGVGSQNSRWVGGLMCSGITAVVFYLGGTIAFAGWSQNLRSAPAGSWMPVSFIALIPVYAAVLSAAVASRLGAVAGTLLLIALIALPTWTARQVREIARQGELQSLCVLAQRVLLIGYAALGILGLHLIILVVLQILTWQRGASMMIRDPVTISVWAAAVILAGVSSAWLMMRVRRWLRRAGEAARYVIMAPHRQFTES